MHSIKSALAVAIFALTASASPAPGSPASLFRRQLPIDEPFCEAFNGQDLNHDKFARLQEVWKSAFSNSGEGDLDGDPAEPGYWAQGVCCDGQCLRIENRSARHISWTGEDFQGGIDQINDSWRDTASICFAPVADDAYLIMVYGDATNTASGSEVGDTIGDTCNGDGGFKNIL